MKIATTLWSAGLLLAVGAGIAQYALVRETHDAVARLTARLIPHGDLRYERLWPFLWGGARVWGLSFQPEGMLSLSLRIPQGFRVQVRELRLGELQLDSRGGIRSLNGTLYGVQLPVASRPAAADPAHQPSPTLFDLGYTGLNFDADFKLEYVESASLAILNVDAHGAGLGRLQSRALLEGTLPVFERAQDQILIRKLEVSFADDGLVRRYKEVAAARAGLSLSAWEAAMIAHLDRRAAEEKWQWDAASARAVRRAIRDSRQFRARIDPPGDVALRNLRLYRVGDWPALLGFSFATADEAAR